jgi:hypothetical protein
MGRAVKRIDRVGHDHPETPFHLHPVTLLHKSVEALEYLQIARPGRRGQTPISQVGHDPVDVVTAHLPHRPSATSQEPFQHRHRAVDRALAERTSCQRVLPAIHTARLELDRPDHFSDGLGPTIN